MANFWDGTTRSLWQASEVHLDYGQRHRYVDDLFEVAAEIDSEQIMTVRQAVRTWAMAQNPKPHYFHAYLIPTQKLLGAPGPTNCSLTGLVPLNVPPGPVKKFSPSAPKLA
jgi:hypothetical protein